MAEINDNSIITIFGKKDLYKKNNEDLDEQLLTKVFKYLNEYFKYTTNIQDYLIILKEFIINELQIANPEDTIEDILFAISSYLHFKFPKQISTCDNCFNLNKNCQDNYSYFIYQYLEIPAKSNCLGCPNFKLVLNNNFDCFTNKTEYDENEDSKKIEELGDISPYIKYDMNDEYFGFNNFYTSLLLKYKLTGSVYIDNKILSFYNKQYFRPKEEYEKYSYSTYIVDGGYILLKDKKNNQFIDIKDLYIKYQTKFETHFVKSLL